MKKISMIGSLLKKTYRIYSNELLKDLQNKGFIDLRPSFLEILMYLCDHAVPSIKEIGSSCGLKKQTMTSHLNELEKRGYILRKTGDKDRRELKVHLTEYGEKFKIALLEVSSNLESQYLDIVGSVEIDRIIHTLENFHTKINKEEQSSQTVLI
jgi:DNA-binding MarR family transcriptional regulator